MGNFSKIQKLLIAVALWIAAGFFFYMYYINNK